MSKYFCSLGLMSGTSGDGIDASIIQSDGDNHCTLLLDRYYNYNQTIYENIHKVKEKIRSSKDLKILSEELLILEKQITLFHADCIDKIVNKFKLNIDFIGFHGQTIFHNPSEKISKQLGDGNLLSKLTKKTVIYNFRQNDLNNGGQGAPLAPLYHKVLKKKLKINNAVFINIGGIANITHVSNENKISGTDIGPGMCLIDRWIRKKTKRNYDIKGSIAKSGKINIPILNQLLENFYEKENPSTKRSIQSFDTNNFNFSFVKELSAEDGAATLTEFSAKIIISTFKTKGNENLKIILCGGGRKNNYLVEKLKQADDRVKLIDEYGVDGDFIESQAFAYLSIRSYLNLPISFPDTTGVIKDCNGGTIVKF